jgi:hypothetical protein
MIPTMLVVGLGLGLLVPRSWPRSLAVVSTLVVLLSFAFGFLVGEPVAGGALALVNAAIGAGLGWVAQGAVRTPARPNPRRVA